MECVILFNKLLPVLSHEIVILLREVFEHAGHAVDDIADVLRGRFEVELHELLETEIGRVSLQQRGVIVVVVLLQCLSQPTYHIGSSHFPQLELEHVGQSGLGVVGGLEAELNLLEVEQLARVVLDISSNLLALFILDLHLAVIPLLLCCFLVGHVQLLGLVPLYLLLCFGLALVLSLDVF